MKFQEGINRKVQHKIKNKNLGFATLKGLNVNNPGSQPGVRAVIDLRTLEGFNVDSHLINVALEN